MSVCACMTFFSLKLKSSICDYTWSIYMFGNRLRVKFGLRRSIIWSNSCFNIFFTFWEFYYYRSFFCHMFICMSVCVFSLFFRNFKVILFSKTIEPFLISLKNVKQFVNTDSAVQSVFMNIFWLVWWKLENKV